MKQAKVLFFLIFALVLASCRPTARQTVADVVQPTDSTDAVTSENTLRMLITDKSLSPLANRLPHTEDTETSIGLYCRGNDE